MDIPFKLNIFKQIEIYQELKELEKQFKKQLKDLYEYKVLKTVYAKNPPLWFFEKKILYWVHIKHKHLGSPVRISYFTHKEFTYEYIHKSSFEKIVEDSKKDIPIIERNLDYINCSIEEIENVQIRKVFGNLEIKGFVKFFKEGENNYLNINQENCDGFFITQKGIEYANMIYQLYEFKNAEGDYKKIKGLKRVLEFKTCQVVKFTAIISTIWLIIFSTMFLFFKTFVEEITDLLRQLLI